MTFEEYKSTFEEILELTEVLEKLCKKNNFEEIDEPFTKRQELFSKLDMPSNLTTEQIQTILQLRDIIKEKNDFIIRAMQVARNKIKEELTSIKTEEKIIEAYKIPSGEIKSSIFDSKE